MQKNISNLPIVLVTFDVFSLSTNISHSNGLSALKNMLPNNQTTSVILHLTKFILEHIHSKFLDEYYLQKKDTAMDTTLAPQCANVFTAYLEEKFLKDSIQKPILYLHYINDTFMLYTHGETTLYAFYSQFNLTDPKFNLTNIEFTMNFASDQIIILDTSI